MLAWPPCPVKRLYDKKKKELASRSTWVVTYYSTKRASLEMAESGDAMKIDEPTPAVEETTVEATEEKT